MATDAPSLFEMITSTVANDNTMMAEVGNKMADSSLPKDLHYVMSAVVGPIFCFLGIVGNLLSIITWLRPKMRSSTGRYLIGQAVADFGVLLFFLLVDSLQAWCPSVKYSPAFGWFFCYIGYPGLFFAVVCSVWYTVGVTADRYIMVCWITKAKHYCNEKRANFGLLLITVNAFFINFPHYFSYTTNHPADKIHDDVNMDQPSHSLVLNTTVDNMEAGSGGDTKNETAGPVESFVPTDFTKGASGQFYEFWIHCMILIIIPWITVFLMNIMIIKTVTKSNKKNANKKTLQAAKNSKESENQITRLLLTVTFSFLFFIGIQCVVQCMYMRKPAGANWLYVDSSFAFAKCGIIFNSSLNFFLYCLTGRRFRKELLAVLGLVDKDSQLSSLVDRPSTSGSSSRNTTSSTGTTGI